MIKAERLYNVTAENNSWKILVDGIWPRGVKKEDPRIDEWKKEVAPSKELRKWYKSGQGSWEEFKKLYEKELEEKADLLNEIKELENQHKEILFLYTVKDTEHNHARILKEFLDNK